MYEIDRPIAYASVQPATRETTLGDILAGFYNRRWMVATLIALGVVGGVVKTKLTKPLYESTSQLVLLQRDPRLAPSSQTAYAVSPVESLETQLSLIQSDAMAERVSNWLKQDAASKGQSTETAGISALDFKRSVFVANQKESNVLVIAARGRTPDQAMEYANAVAQAFVQWKNELSRTDASSAEASLQIRAQRAREDVDRAEAKLTAFEHENGMVDIKQQTSELLSRLAQRETTVGDLQGEYASAKARYEALGQKLTSMNASIRDGGGVRDDSLVLSLQSQLNTLEMQRVQQAQTVTPAFPGTLSTLDAQIADIKKRLSVAIQGTVDQKRPSLQSQGNIMEGYRQAELDMRYAQARLNAALSVRDQLVARSKQLPKIGLEFARLQRNADIATTVYSGILGALEAARSDRDMTTGNVQVAQAGTVPDAPVEPKPVLNILIGLIAGAMLATFAVVALEGGARRVYTMNQLSTLISGPVIGVLPLWSRRQQRAMASGSDPSKNSWRSALPVRDAFGRTSARLSLALPARAKNGPGQAIMVTSATSGEGVSTVSSQISHQLAMSGNTVILVDANFRKPSQHRRYGGDPNQGLIAMLRDSSSLDQTIQGTKLPKLQIVVAGDFTLNDEALVGSEQMKVFLDYARTKADFVIIDTQACDTPVPMLMSKLIDCVVQVVGMGKTTEKVLQETQDALAATGKPVLTVVNRASGNVGTLPPSYPVRQSSHAPIPQIAADNAATHGRLLHTPNGPQADRTGEANS